jgi:hypothetical protein
MKQIEMFNELPKNPEHRHHIRIVKMFDYIQYQCGCGRYFTNEQNHLFEGITDEDLDKRGEDNDQRNGGVQKQT